MNVDFMSSHSELFAQSFYRVHLGQVPTSLLTTNQVYKWI